jgi:hypothetical protein
MGPQFNLKSSLGTIINTLFDQFFITSESLQKFNNYSDLDLDFDPDFDVIIDFKLYFYKESFFEEKFFKFLDNFSKKFIIQNFPQEEEGDIFFFTFFFRIFHKSASVNFFYNLFSLFSKIKANGLISKSFFNFYDSEHLIEAFDNKKEVPKELVERLVNYFEGNKDAFSISLNNEFEIFFSNLLGNDQYLKNLNLKEVEKKNKLQIVDKDILDLEKE